MDLPSITLKIFINNTNSKPTVNVFGSGTKLVKVEEYIRSVHEIPEDEVLQLLIKDKYGSFAPLNISPNDILSDIANLQDQDLLVVTQSQATSQNNTEGAVQNTTTDVFNITTGGAFGACIDDIIREKRLLKDVPQEVVSSIDVWEKLVFIAWILFSTVGHKELVNEFSPSAIVYAEQYIVRLLRRILNDLGLSVMELNQAKKLPIRQEIVNSFNGGSVLLTSDDDVTNLNMPSCDLVLHFELPTNEKYKKRILKAGSSVCLIMESETDSLIRIEHYMNREMELVAMPNKIKKKVNYYMHVRYTDFHQLLFDERHRFDKA